MSTTPSSTAVGRFRKNLGNILSTLGFAAFIAVSLLAKWSPVLAQGTPAKKKANQKKSAPIPAFTREIPAANTKVDHKALAKIIDQEINRQLQAEKITPSGPADDAEFLRRVYLDLVGVIPSPEKVSAFLKDTSPERRAKVIDELLADPHFGTTLAEVWSGLLMPRESNNRRLDHKPLQKWLADGFNTNRPLDQLVYELLTSTGDQDKNGAVTYFVANPTVDKMTDNVTRMFMGVQLQCAQCHNHPFTDFKQTDYWGMAAFFMKVRLTANPQQAAKKGVAPGITEGVGNAKGKGKNKKLPESAKIVPAKFLHDAQPIIKDNEPSRPVLAKWITGPNNPYFAKAMVNRFWYQLFGRGLVNPVDDIQADSPGTHPELFAALVEQFKGSGFDVKYLLRAICNSEAYQRTSNVTKENAGDADLYSHRLVRVLTPEQLYDSLVLALGHREGVTRKGPGGKKGPPTTGRDGFVNFFRVDGADPLEYQVGIPQELRLMNSAQVNGLGNALTQATKNASGQNEIIENLFLRSLSRRPTPQELQRMTTYVRNAPDARTGYGDIFWALLNASEFTMNH